MKIHETPGHRRRASPLLRVNTRSSSNRRGKRLMLHADAREECVDFVEQVRGNEEYRLPEIPDSWALHEPGVHIGRRAGTGDVSVGIPVHPRRCRPVARVYVPSHKEPRLPPTATCPPNTPHSRLSRRQPLRFRVDTRKTRMDTIVGLGGSDVKVVISLERPDWTHRRYTGGISSPASLNGFSAGGDPPARRRASSFCPRSSISGL